MAEPTLQSGSTGEAVRELQTALKEQQRPGPIDGVFGPNRGRGRRPSKRDAASRLTASSVRLPGATSISSLSSTSLSCAKIQLGFPWGRHRAPDRARI